MEKGFELEGAGVGADGGVGREGQRGALVAEGDATVVLADAQPAADDAGFVAVSRDPDGPGHGPDRNRPARSSGNVRQIGGKKIRPDSWGKAGLG